ncbi:MAG: hypothetical protein JST14_01030, partial [Bacteroidetes bacterium]|nr:hypothetical protein [Bacteroidota bacterium]
LEQIICNYNGEKSYPMALRHDLVQQMPMLKKKYLKYANYRDQTIDDIFTKEQMKGMITWTGNELRTSVIINQGGGKFEVRPLPVEAQFSPVYGILIDDFDKDGITDILLGGNLYRTKPEVGRYDASYGCLLRGTADGRYEFVPRASSGIFLDGEVRDICSVKVGKQSRFMVSRNNAPLIMFKVR